MRKKLRKKQDGGQPVKGHCQVPDCGMGETSDKEQYHFTVPKQSKLKAKLRLSGSPAS